jgi:hypothetical protein
MTTGTTWHAREQVDSLKKRYENMYRFPEAELKVKNGSTVITVTCAIHGNFEISLDDTSDVCLCKKCSPFFYHLMSTSDKQKAFETIREIYYFAFDNRRLVDRFRKTTKNNHNNMNVFYTMFKEAKRAKEEAEPVVVHQVATSTTSGVYPPRSYRGTSQVLADLNAVFDNTLVFPELGREYYNVTSALTVICPIHGKTKASFSKMFWSKSACLKCRPLRRKLLKVYGKEHVFEKLLEQYRKAKDNPDYVEPSLDQLMIDAGKTTSAMMGKFDSVASDIVNQCDKDGNSMSEMLSIMSGLVEYNSKSEMLKAMSDLFKDGPAPDVSDQEPQTLDNWEQNIVPVDEDTNKSVHYNEPDEPMVSNSDSAVAAQTSEPPEAMSPTRKRASAIVAFFNNLNLSDIVKFQTDIDLETDEEITTVSLRSGGTIKIFD